MKKILFILLLGGFFTSCAPKVTTRLYNLNNYKEAVNNYLETGSEESITLLMKIYSWLIENPRGTRMVPPPGIYAEYGYLLIQTDRIKEGLDLPKKEIALYPGSNTFLQHVIKNLEE